MQVYLTIGKKIFGGVTLLVCFTLLVSGTSLYILKVTRDSYTQLIEVNQRLVLEATRLRVAVLKKSEGYRGFLLYGQEVQIEGWLDGAREFRAICDEMDRLVSTPQERQMIDEITGLEKQLAEKQQQVIDLRRKGAIQDILDEAALVRPFRVELFEKVDKFIDLQNQIRSEARDRVSTQINLISIAMYLISGVALIAAAALSWWLTGSITHQLRESIFQLTTSSNEIVATTAQVASGAVETASAINQTTATVEEVKQTAHVATQKARIVSESAQKAAQVSQKGKATVTETVNGMERIRLQMESIAAHIVKLNEQNQSIREIIASVSDLAEQSNLLAVNAAIEAAKAGDLGKGFGVVAQEVRSLAEQSKQATIQIRTILNDIQKAMTQAVMATEQGAKVVEIGVKLSLEAGETIRLLSESIGESSQAATQIVASCQQQLVGMDQVASAMDSIRLATSQNMAGTKQAEQAAHTLNQLGQNLRALIEST
ncbi:MAG: CHASE3 domain-containing protein [Acidobacteria bacterium]|nr:CHASE3 domain-containing protein [Acidobacteriota bacterium]